MRHLKSRISRKLCTLPRDTAGNILPLAAAGMLVAAAVVGSAVDFSREYKVQNQLQSACDAAVLAGRRTVTTNGFDDASNTVAKNYFSTNFDDTGQETTGTSFLAHSDDDGQTVQGTASTTLNTLIMRLFGFATFDISVQCASSMGVGNADVMMVLDTTGSMTQNKVSNGQTRLAALQDAMKNFYKTLATATASSNARIRYGFVPYSSTVNVGKLLYELDPNYLAGSWTYQSREANYLDYASATKKTTSTVSSGSMGDSALYSATKYTSSSKCKNAVPSTTSWASGGGTVISAVSGTSPTLAVTRNVTTGNTRTAYSCSGSGSSYYIYQNTESSTSFTRETWSGVSLVSGSPASKSEFYSWTYKPVARDTSAFKAFAATSTYTGAKGVAQSTTWNGCIEERATTTGSTFSYSSTNGYSPSGARDIDIDSAPTSDSSTKWGPQWYQVSYTRGPGVGDTSNWTQSNASDGTLSTEYCPARAQLLTEMSQSSFNGYADALTAKGGTYLDIGMIWGGRLASPNGIFSGNVNLAPSNGGEVSRHLIFMTDGEMDTSNYSTSAWGLDWWDRRVTTDGAEATADARHYSRFLAVCDAIKAKGIRIWVIAFTSSLSSQLQTCASDGSSYTAGDAAELDTAFQEIAKQVGELRVTL